MADLDDFFAKKDKKKGKSKKFISSDELVRQLEQPAVTKEETKVENSETKVSTEGNLLEQNEDDEWATNYEELKRVDLSNLKLGQLTITDEQEQNQSLAERNAEKYQMRSDDGSNPWSKQGDGASGQPQPTNAVATEPAKPASNVYVPPSVLKGEMMKNRKKKNLPDLQNEGQFPELGTNKPVELRSNKKDGFEEVKHGAAFKNVQSQQAPVSVGNTYSSLLNDAESS